MKSGVTCQVTKDGSDENSLKPREKHLCKLRVMGLHFCVDCFVEMLPIYRSLFNKNKKFFLLENLSQIKMR